MQKDPVDVLVEAEHYSNMPEGGQYTADLLNETPSIQDIHNAIAVAIDYNSNDHHTLIRCLFYLANESDQAKAIVEIPRDIQDMLSIAVQNILAEPGEFSRKLQIEWLPYLPKFMSQPVQIKPIPGPLSPIRHLPAPRPQSPIEAVLSPGRPQPEPIRPPKPLPKSSGVLIRSPQPPIVRFRKSSHPASPAQPATIARSPGPRSTKHSSLPVKSKNRFFGRLSHKEPDKDESGMTNIESKSL
jgi:hypothetical protein